MKVNIKCPQCNGKGKHQRELKIGDIVTPQDGSSMCSELHDILWNGHGVKNLPLPQDVAFKSVRIIAIQGKMLAVWPLCWDDGNYHTSQGASSIWNGESYPMGKQLGKGFWIDAYVSHLKEMV